MDANLLDRYAELIVSVGANVQPDQVLAVEALPEAQPLGHGDSPRGPTRRGARFVDVQYFDPRSEADPGGVRARGYARLGAAVDGPADARPRRPRRGARRARPARSASGLLDGVDPGGRGLDRPADDSRDVQGDRRALDRLDALALPDRGLGAKVVYPDLDAQARRSSASAAGRRARLPPRRASTRLRAWEKRIDQIWRSATRARRARPRLDPLRGPGHRPHGRPALPSSRFAKEGGSSQTRTGVRHLPNIPTEEVHTTPDPARTNGVVTATKAARHIRARSWPASASASRTAAPSRSTPIRTRGTLRQRCAADDGRHDSARSRSWTAKAGSASSGERSSRTLLDENAASHLALGDAYPLRSATPATCRASTRVQSTSTSHDRLRRRRRHRHHEGGRAGADPARAATGSSECLGLGDQVVRLGQRLDRILRILERVLRNEDGERIVLACRARLPRRCRRCAESSASSSASVASPATDTCTIRAIAAPMIRARAPAFDEPRRAPLRERHLDHVEVAGTTVSGTPHAPRSARSAPT